MTKIIGLTGGIGSGKTTIANYFQSLGIPVYIADDEAKKLMQSDEIVSAIKEAFGADLFEENMLKREKLAEMVFNNSDKLNQLNAIVHPAVKRHFKQWLLEHNEFPIVIYEAAILFESGSYKDFDKIITVTAPVDLRIERVIKRDNTSREQVLKRMNAQWTDEQRISKSDFVIENVDFENCYKEIKKILKILNIRQNEA
ncbi:dephospho-CoA kinase [Flavobacterium sp. W1B]|uniref:dephospho-CoA kinase n=1 Tax=Flavobacterium sp. W1B TaxID=3394146 RepID=UPI0039BD50C0